LHELALLAPRKEGELVRFATVFATKLPARTAIGELTAEERAALATWLCICHA
jgi:hypothetical protein